MASNPTDAPPPYSQDPSGHLAVPAGSTQGVQQQPSRQGHRRTNSNASSNYTSEEDHDESGIPDEGRRELIDAERPLPEGWRREFDTNTQHFFYVDTRATPPRSIWSHPLDDPDFLDAHPEIAKEFAPPAGAPPAETSATPSVVDEKKGHHSLFHRGGDDKAAEEERRGHNHDHDHASTSAKKDDRTLGRKMKDKLTGKTHEERVKERKDRAERERREYDEYLRRRGEMLRAVNAGQYRSSYSAPQGPYRVQPMYGGRYGGGGMYGRGMYGGRGYGYYPAGPMGYGNGIGMMGRGPGMGMAMGGGLLGGLLLGDMLF
ncbi:hypothetical protein JCM3775_003516 [Rhodotorula graminis]|uniref:WW domain-containing protein n=1 Tax=Rhodotorula graminis (strain WP1) TaxID=578459 RepID=A0A0P9ENE7_RHOGW|nr:uncharacterized protein RHOBADRAFT_54776 [Rhodotorula graminis WP1]KPV73570.1 hypothetical protein RHOBADRAFT_54776 [Rhodotorula graminis WP1]